MKPSNEIEKIVRKLGINNVSILDGGFPDWTYDFPKIISNKVPTVKEGNFVAKFNPNILVDLNYVKKRIHKVPMMESRPSRYYYGTEQ